ncbi:MAG: YbbR-like domain-containing protein [Candidatus Ornithomonoglobus sp.]
MAQKESEKKQQNKKRGPYLAASLIIAIIIWSLVTFTTDTEITKTIHDVDVSYVGEQALKERGFVVTGVGEGADLWIKLGGRRGDLINTIDRVRVELDVSAITASGETELEGTVKTYNSQVEVIKKSFTYVPVIAEEYKTKEIPIHVKQIGSYKNNPVVSEPEFHTIEISGAKSEIDRIAEGCVTVDLSKLTDSGTTSSGVVLMDSDGEVITDAVTIEGPTSEMTISNVVCECAELTVKPVLGDSLYNLTQLDEFNTKIDPQTVTAGIMPGYSFSEVKAVINEYTTDEISCELIVEDGMYIPDNEKYVKITPAFTDQTTE